MINYYKKTKKYFLINGLDDKRLFISHSKEAKLFQNISDLYGKLTVHTPKTIVDDSQNLARSGNLSLIFYRNMPLNNST